MYSIIKDNIQGKKIFILFLITQIVYFTMIFVTIPKIASINKNIKIFDIRPFGYSYEEALELLEHLDTKGREIYLFQQIPLDLIYPSLFGITFCLVLAFFLNKIKLLNSKYIYLTLLPLFSGAFDYLENFSIIQMLTNYPTISEKLVNLASVFTILKSLLTSIYFFILIFVLIKYLFFYLKNKNNAL